MSHKLLSLLSLAPLALPAVAADSSITGTYLESRTCQVYTGPCFANAETALVHPTTIDLWVVLEGSGTLTTGAISTGSGAITLASGDAVTLNANVGGAGSSLITVNANTNGLNSFTSGNGAIGIDLGPWMTPAYTSNTGIPGLVNALSSLLTGGQLSTTAKNAIVSYVTSTNPLNFPYTVPTNTEMRNRVRAVVHLIVVSPDFIVQK
jgi:hypothetical protein